MCGIAGICGIGAEKMTSQVERMTEAMAHRGPDDWGFFQYPGIAFGHRRLSIIDTSTNGHQPMVSQCGRYVIIFNGEVYNFIELKKNYLNDIKLKSDTDTEVVLELWVKIGQNCLPKLRGMFAFAIWDKVSNELFIARDHLGIKPIYFTTVDNLFLFSSELKGLFASRMIPFEPDEEALGQYLSIGYILQPRTIAKNIFCLEPGSILRYICGKYTINRFWSLEDVEGEIITDEEAIIKVRELVESSVEEEIISDRPLGVFLSGGLDSTCIVAALKNKGHNVKTFSIGFDNDDLSEHFDVEESIKYYNVEHTQLNINSNEILENIDDFIKSLDQPSIDGLNTWLISRAASEHVKVTLSGLGGDEVFSGYSIDRKILYNRKIVLNNLIHLLRPIWCMFPDKIQRALENRAAWTKIETAYPQWGKIFSDREVSKLLKRKIKPISYYFKEKDLKQRKDDLKHITNYHINTFMRSRLLRDTDAVSMRHSLEVRVPLIDVRIVSYVWSLPLSIKLKDIKNSAQYRNYEKESSYKKDKVKYLLFKAFEKNLPQNFGERSKRGFKLPINKWLNENLKDDVVHQFLNKNGLLDHEQKIALLKRWNNGKESWTKIYSVYVLEKWYISMQKET